MSQKLDRHDIFRFWNVRPDGDKAYIAYEHINSYFKACLLQYERIYNLWINTSANKLCYPVKKEEFDAKSENMDQVICDIHFLLISLQVIWKTLQQLSNLNLYPNFGAIEPLKIKWQPFFKQFREPRNTFEHYDDQIFGPDTRRNSPGQGTQLNPDGGFALGTHGKVFVNPKMYNDLIQFKIEFEACIDSIVGPAPPYS